MLSSLSGADNYAPLRMLPCRVVCVLPVLPEAVSPTEECIFAMAGTAPQAFQTLYLGASVSTPTTGYSLAICARRSNPHMRSLSGSKCSTTTGVSVMTVHNRLLTASLRQVHKRNESQRQRFYDAGRRPACSYRKHGAKHAGAAGERAHAGGGRGAGRGTRRTKIPRLVHDTPCSLSMTHGAGRAPAHRQYTVAPGPAS